MFLTAQMKDGTKVTIDREDQSTNIPLGGSGVNNEGIPAYTTWVRVRPYKSSLSMMEQYEKKLVQETYIQISAVEMEGIHTPTVLMMRKEAEALKEMGVDLTTVRVGIYEECA